MSRRWGNSEDSATALHTFERSSRRLLLQSELTVVTLSTGKQARPNNNDEPQSKRNHSPPQTNPNAQKMHDDMGMSEPAIGVHHGHAHAQAPAPAPEAYSMAPADNQNRAAQAGHAAAHAVEPKQNVSAKGNKNRNVNDEELARLVAEENESRNKFPRYPGLERWVLLEKMGDGAFSNVYRARDSQGAYGEVGIKVVRKYEMNSMQVSFVAWRLLFTAASIFSSFRLAFGFFVSHTNLGARALGKQPFTSGLQEGPQSCRGARNFSLLCCVAARHSLRQQKSFVLIRLLFPMSNDFEENASKLPSCLRHDDR